MVSSSKTASFPSSNESSLVVSSKDDNDSNKHDSSSNNGSGSINSNSSSNEPNDDIAHVVGNDNDLSNRKNSLEEVSMIPNSNSDISSPTKHKDFQVEAFDLLLLPEEKKKIRCPLVTLRRGILRITGITLKLCGILEGYREIQLPQRRLNITAAHPKGIFYEANNDLTIRVTSAMPLLDIEMQHFPTHMMQGQIEKLMVDFKNSGTSPLHNIRVCLSHPSFFYFGIRDNEKKHKTILPLFV